MSARQTETQGRLWEAVRRLHPGYPASVMATGIISSAAKSYGYDTLSAIFLGVGLAAYALLMAAFLLRLRRFPGDVRADLRTPQKAFAFFTLVASANVLAARLAAAGSVGWAVALAVPASLVWAVLTYALPYGLIFRPGQAPLEKLPMEKAFNGSWLTWVVGTQSVSVAASVLAAREQAWSGALADGAVLLWGVGVILYLILITVVIMRLFFAEVDPGDLVPSYWISMGACAITVRAGSLILALPPDLPVIRVAGTVVQGLSFLFWAFGTWWFPMLVVWGVWRHFIRKVPLAYEPSLWSMVFPLGMYAASSESFGHVTRLPWVVAIGGWELWAAVAAWLLVGGGMLLSWLPLERRAVQPGPSPGGTN